MNEERSPRSRRRRLADRLLATAQALPGAERVRERAERVEQMLLRELKARLDRMADAERMLPPPSAEGDATGVLRGRMAKLIDRNADQSRDEAFAELCARLIDQLLPDEARILAALSDGGSYPVIHLLRASRVGGDSEYLRRFVTDIGKPARLRVPECAPHYLARLELAGLVECGPADERMEMRYQILEAEREVRALVEAHGGSLARTLRIQRRTVRLSWLGREFWRVAGPT